MPSANDLRESLVHLPAALIFAVSAAAALAGSWLLTGVVRRLAVRFGWAPKPTSARHVHTRATPRLGGIAIFLTTTTLLAAGVWLTGPHGPFAGQLSGRTTLALAALERVLLPATMLFLVGVWDDARPLPARLKLLCQIGAGVWLYGLGYSVFGPVAQPLFSAHGLLPHAAGLAATVVWVVWITNAINLIDGLDGLAAGSSLFSLLTLFIAAYLHGSHTVALGAAILAGATIGFLRHNFNPASIFLGDGGSLFLGFLLSALGLMESAECRTPLPMTIALPALAFGLPLMEVVLSVARRFLSGKRLFEADRMHMHHKLLDRGLSHRQAVLALWAASGVFGLLALILVYPTWLGMLCSLSLLLLLGTAAVVRLGYAEFSELARIPRRTLQQRRVIANAVVLERTVRMLDQAASLDAIRTALLEMLPVSCSLELRFHLLPRNGHGPAQGFRLRPEGLSEHPGERTTRLVMELHSPEYQGSLEFFLQFSAQSMILNVHQLTARLHPALDGALSRLPAPRSAEPARTPALPGFALGEVRPTLGYVQ